MRTLILLILSTSCLAQNQFVHVYDSMTVSLDAVDGSGKQILYETRKVPVTFPVSAGKFRLVVYTGKDAGPVEKYCQFTAVYEDTVDTSGNPSIKVTSVASSYLAVVPKSAMTGTLSQKIPIMRVYEGGSQKLQTWLFTSGNYYYCYLRQTKADQVFRIDWSGGGDLSKMDVVNPVPGKSKTFSPLTNTITVDITDPFR